MVNRRSTTGKGASDRKYVIGGVYNAKVHTGGPVKSHYVIVAEVKPEGVKAHVCTSQSSAVARGAIEIGSMIVGERETFVFRTPELIPHELILGDTRRRIDAQLAKELGIRL